MFAIADRRSRMLHARAEMRPRRWYTDERAPPARAARVTGELWRYRVLAQRRTNNAAPTLERRRCFRNIRGAFGIGPAGQLRSYSSSKVSRTPSFANSSCASGQLRAFTNGPSALAFEILSSTLRYGGGSSMSGSSTPLH